MEKVEVEIPQLLARLVDEAGRLVVCETVFEHGLDILPPQPNIGVLILLDFLLNRCQIHGIVDSV
jgi:hypothetical protein